MKVVTIMTYDIKNLYYTQSGQGKSIIFLHGWGHNSEFFKPLVNLFAINYNCICIDLPGWGNSPLYESLDIDDYVEILHDFINKKKIEVFAIIGHSWGGKIGFRYALKYNVKKLILAGASICSPRFSFLKYFRILKYKLYKKLAKISRLEKFFKSKMELMGSRDYLNAKGLLKEVLVKSVNTFYDDYLMELKVPTLIYWGEMDKETPLYMGKKLHREIIGSKLKVVKNSDHFAMIKCRYNFTVVTSNFLKEGN